MLATRMEPHAAGPVRVARLGSGPPLVLLHGYPDTLQIWSALAPLLAERFDVIAFDWPGLGDSAAWPGPLGPVDRARQLASLLEAWALAPAVLVAHDMGGPAALACAAMVPARVGRVVVMNSLVVADAPTSWEIALLRRPWANRLLVQRLPRSTFWRALATATAAPLPGDVRADLWRCFRRPEVRRTLARMCADYQRDLPGMLAHHARVACPTLALWGTTDRHFPPAQGQALCSQVPGAELVIVEGGHHWMAAEEPRRIADLIISH